MGGLTLTTHRVILYVRSRGGESSTSVLLSQVQWTRLTRAHAQPVLIGLTVLATLVLGLALAGPIDLAWPLGVLLLIAAVLGSQHNRTRLVVGAGTRTLSLPLEPDPQRRRQARELVDMIEQAAASASGQGSMLYSA